MRAFFSVLGILVALLIVGLLAKTMLRSGATGAAPAGLAKQASDGTITLKSFSYWGQGDAAEAFRQELAELEERNRQARAEWDSLTPEEREQRTRDFEAQKKARAEAMRDAAEIPPHVLAKIDGKEPPDPDAVFT